MLLIFFSGGKEPVLNVAKMEDDPQRRKPDISRARSILGWEPKVRANSFHLLTTVSIHSIADIEIRQSRGYSFNAAKPSQIGQKRKAQPECKE